MTTRVAVIAALMVFYASGAPVAASPGARPQGAPVVSRPHRTVVAPPLRPPAPPLMPSRPRVRPWVEGVTPPLENALFAATYKVLPTHNVLKIYVFDAGGYESAGIRFSARIAHQQRNFSEDEMIAEAATLIRTTFESFPEIQTLDVWGTIPVAESMQTRVEDTVFSVTADRATYLLLRRGEGLSDREFISAFGRVWISPQVPQ